MRGNVASFGLATALLAGCWWFDTSTPDAPSVALSASASVRLSANPSASAAPSASGFASAAPSAAASASTSGSSSSSPPASSAPATWTYGGATGPSFWGDLHADFARCKSGARQSPVDLPSSADRVAMPGATKAEAGKKASKPAGNTKKAATAAGSSAKARPAANDPRALSVDYLPFPALVRNDGWAIEITNRSNNYVTVGGKRFELLTAQFHSPSEHTIAGKRFDLELQLRHKAGDGAEVAIAVLFERGATPEPLAELWKRLPTTPNAEPEAPPAKAKPFDAGALVSLADGYFVYEGSHTTPPCAEGVTWFVLKRPATIAPRDVERYRELFGGRTNRMVMPLGGRAVTELVP
jgi:carbonic anhydrase